MSKNILVTGGAGFIGSSFVIQQVSAGDKVVVLDKLTYAGSLENLSSLSPDSYHFIKGDILDFDLVRNILAKHDIDIIVHFAAESHVDNSIANPDIFITTNINGTHTLLRAALERLEQNKKIHFHHISTDEVFGDLPLAGNEKFSETTSYNPSSPYSASKAASDHLVRSYQHTYGLPTTLSNCSNNFGPRQHQEKLIPTIINKALTGQQIPIYGDGKNVRDWIHVDDHNQAVALILEKGKIGETYCIGGNAELSNNEVVHKICEILDEAKPAEHGNSYKTQITYVADRKGHDRRYAIDDSKIVKELGFKRSYNFATGIRALLKECF